jgi:inner membrane protein involved in colicin E2 resistance
LEVTPFGDPIFQRGLQKLAILPDYKHPGMLCLALPARRKVQKLDFQSEFSMSKIIQISLIFVSLKNNKLGSHFLLK